MAEALQESLRSAIADLMGWLDEAEIPSMLVGGVAASVLGRPRLTRDVDALAVLPETQWPEALQAASRHGIVPRITDALLFARRSRVLLLRHASSAIDIDVIIGALPFEEAAVAHGSSRDLGGTRVRLPRVEDLLVMKAVARRPKDLEDLAGLLTAHPGADVAGARRWVREFSTAMNAPEILSGFDALVSQRDAGR